MKLILTTTLALLLSSAAAMALSFPAHEPDGYRDTGCVASERTDITNAAGKLLYSNNPTCPEGNDGHEVAEAEAPEEPEEPEDETDPEDKTGDDASSGDGER